MKVAVYVRVSTADQRPDNQLISIRQYCQLRGWKIYREYVDYYSGASFDRPAFNQLNDDARKRRFNAIVIWKLDRLGRSLKELIDTLNFYKDMGIALISITDAIDTTTPEGRLFFHVVGAFAEYERDLIRERVKLGQQRAIMEGKRIGRPTNVSPEVKAEVIRLYKSGVGKKKIARRFHIGVGTVIKIINENKDGD